MSSGEALTIGSTFSSALSHAQPCPACRLGHVQPHYTPGGLSAEKLHYST